MELRSLKYFLAVAEEKNISRAAEALHVTQPTLSRQMTQLETELGARLFVRGRGFELTDAGLMLRRRAEEVLELTAKIEEDMASRREVVGVISIGCGGLASFRELADVLTGFRALYPRCSFRLYANSAEYVKERMEAGLLDFGLLLEPVDIGRFDYIRMRTKERWGLLINSSHPLASKDYIERSDVLNETLAVSARLPVQGELESWLGVPLSRLDVLASHNLIINSAMLVQAGAACALTLEGSADMYAHDVVFRPLFPELVMTSVFAWKRLRPDIGAAARFLEYFKSMH